LTSPPPGYGWGYVDGDVLLYSLATRLIVDLVSNR
jgi:Ni/Co efflux regulator RcnB